MKVRRFLFFCLILVSFLFLACKNSSNKNRLYLDDSVYWAPTDYLSTVFDAKDLEYKKLSDFKSRNLERLVGNDGKYCWLKIDFTLPSALKYRSLGFVIPYVHFAEVAYLNNICIGGYGIFPPSASSAQHKVNSFILPYENLNMRETNTIYIKVYCYGWATVSDGIFIDEYEHAKAQADFKDFFQSGIYIFFEGALLIAVILFIMLGAKQGKEGKGRAYFVFAGMNLLTIFFLSYFFGTDILWYNDISINVITLFKIFIGIPLYLIIFHIPLFIRNYLDLNEHRAFLLIRAVLLAVCIVISCFVKTYAEFCKTYPYILAALFCQFGFACYYLIKGYRNPKTMVKAMDVFAAFSPLILSIITDCFVHDVLQHMECCYFAIYGWITTIVIFIFFLTRDYKTTLTQVTRLSKHFEEEVQLKTVDLTFANEKLEQEISKSARDMDMASIVQRKFYPQTENFFDGWELSVCFRPMDKISGDLYDYYTNGTTLDGFGLFDVSGHGVAASLVCMLARSIIFRAFVHGKKDNETLAVVLEYINERLIEDKGEVNNYMTGLLFRIGNFDIDGKCLVELASAGHPYPVYYSAQAGKMVTVKHDEFQEQYGALGINGVDVSFPNVDLTVSEGDIIVAFTDGVTEAVDENSQEYGTERLSQVVYKNRFKNAKEIHEAIIEDLKLFTEGVLQTDDVSFIVLKRVPRWKHW